MWVQVAVDVVESFDGVLDVFSSENVVVVGGLDDGASVVVDPSPQARGAYRIVWDSGLFIRIFGFPDPIGVVGLAENECILGKAVAGLGKAVAGHDVSPLLGLGSRLSRPGIQPGSARQAVRSGSGIRPDARPLSVSSLSGSTERPACDLLAGHAVPYGRVEPEPRGGAFPPHSRVWVSLL